MSDNRGAAAAPAIDRALLVAGLGFGDEGKGSVVDWLVRRHGAGLVVRYNGGPQAAHHVVTTAGLTHCFAQIGAGALSPGVRTFLSRHMLVDPLALQAEVAALAHSGVSDAWERLLVDPRCVVVTPFHRLLNQLEERARGAGRHGSCGRGVGQAQLDSERAGLPVLRIGDLKDEPRLSAVLRLLWQLKVDQAEQIVAAAGDPRPELAALLADLRAPHRPPALVKAYRDLLTSGRLRLAEAPAPSAVAVFEGAQGVLLDRDHGFFPHVTPSRTTFQQADALLDEWGVAARLRVGVLRAYATRHGQGPLPSEDDALTQALPDRHNGTDPWQGAFRCGHFDAPLGRYALAVCGGVDALVLTCLDRLHGRPLRLVRSYQQGEVLAARQALASVPGARGALTRWLAQVHLQTHALPPFGDDAEPYVARVEEALGVPVAALSRGPTAADKSLRAAPPGL